jgi:cell division protein FtsL
MATVAAPARRRSAAQPQRRPSARPRPRPRPAARPRVAGGVAWIVLVAALLAGIVALNVTVLRLNMQAEELEARQAKLAAEHDRLKTELSTAAGTGRVQAIATEKLGLVRPDETTYVHLGRAKR